jgi:hypothetical protein
MSETMAIFMQFWHTSAKQYVRSRAREDYRRIRRHPDKTSPGGSSVHPIRQEKTAVSANPFAAW